MDENEGDDFGAAWDRMSEQAEAAGDATGSEPEVLDIGPPIRVTLTVKADKPPVAPWAQGWRVGATPPMEGHITMLFEHDVLDSPVAQLAAVTGLLSTVKQARLEVAWWAIQARGPLPGEGPDAEPDIAQELSDFLISREDAGEDS